MKILQIFKWISIISISFFYNQAFAQPWTADEICDFTSGQQWNNSPSIPCACTWLSLSGSDTIINCAFGDCGQSDFLECIYDCNGHNGNNTDQIQRDCNGADPLCWYQATGQGPDGSEFCGAIALPVEFIGMDGYTNGNSNVIEWSTASEYNTSHFIIEKSISSENFEFVVSVPSNGTTQMESNYRAIDVSPEDGVSYYKLTQYDIDGKYEHLGYIAIDNRPKEIETIIDMMGREVDMMFNGIKIIIFIDGSTRKVY